MLPVASVLSVVFLVVPGAIAARDGNPDAVSSMHARKLTWTLSGECEAPYGAGIEGLDAVLSVSKLQRPESTTKETSDSLTAGFCDEYFFLQGDYVRLIVPDLAEERSELRIPDSNSDEGTDGFIIEEAVASLQATLRLPNTNIGSADSYTWMQVHSGGGSPYLRFAHYGEKTYDGETYQDYLWYVYKIGSEDSHTDNSFPIAAVPIGDFDASIAIDQGTISIAVAGYTASWTIEWDIDDGAYFKAGSYPDDEMAEFAPVDYRSLVYTLESGVFTT